MSLTAVLNFDAEAQNLLSNLDKLKAKIRNKQKDDVEDLLRASARPLHRPKSVWMFFVISFFIVSAFYGIYLLLFHISWAHIIYAILLWQISLLGLTASVHRYYSHKTFKANFPLQIVLMLLQTMATSDTIYRWVRDHRMHHKYTDTDADPINTKNGLFFSHFGWLLVKKHPMVKWKGKGIDMSDIEVDPIVMFQKKYYYELWFIFNVVLPMLFPVFVLGESVTNTFFVCVCLKSFWTEEMLFFINSWSHWRGSKSYDTGISATNSTIAHILSAGEGWHNFHHAFPLDYRSSEVYSIFNVASSAIELCAYFGWASDLKKASPAAIAALALRSGDGTRLFYVNEESRSIEDSAEL